jgi:hypothetical protein
MATKPKTKPIPQSADDAAADWAKNNLAGGAGGMPENPEGGLADQGGGSPISITKSRVSELGAKMAAGELLNKSESDELAEWMKSQRQEETIDARRAELGAKMAEGDLSKSEQRELVDLLSKAKKKDEDEEDESDDQEGQEGKQGEEAEGEGEEEGEEKTEKSRRAELGAKMAAGELLSKAEQDELVDFMKSQTTPPAEVPVVDAEALEKSMDALAALAAGQEAAATDRRAELGAKMAEGDLSKSEEQELLDLLKSRVGGEPEVQGAEVDPLNKGGTAVAWGQEPKVAEAYEVAPYLAEMNQLLGNAIDGIKSDLSKSETSRRAFNVGLAKALQGVGRVVQASNELIKSVQEENTAIKQQYAVLSNRLGLVEAAPLPYKGNGRSAKVLNKSFSGNTSGENLTPDQISDGLETLLSKSMADGRGMIAPCGEDLGEKIPRWESAHLISEALVNDVRQALQG